MNQGDQNSSYINPLDQFLEGSCTDLEALKDMLKDKQTALALIEKMRQKALWNRDVIKAIRDRFPSKEVTKAIKKLAYVLSQKGIQVDDEELLQKETPKIVYINPQQYNPIKKAFSTVPMGFNRLRLGCYFMSKSQCLYIYHSPVKGIRKALLIDASTFEDLQKEGEIDFVSIPPEHALLTVQIAYGNSNPYELDTIHPKTRSTMESLVYGPKVTINSVFYKYLDVKDLEGSENFDEKEIIFTLGEILVDNELINEYAVKYGEVRNPTIIVSDYIIREKIELLLDDLIEKLFAPKSKEEILFAIKEQILFSKYMGKEIKKELFAAMIIFEKEHKKLLREPIETYLYAMYQREQKKKSLLAP